jgi:hypothetical protein
LQAAWRSPARIGRRPPARVPADSARSSRLPKCADCGAFLRENQRFPDGAHTWRHARKSVPAAAALQPPQTDRKYTEFFAPSLRRSAASNAGTARSVARIPSATSVGIATTRNDDMFSLSRSAFSAEAREFIAIHYRHPPVGVLSAMLHQTIWAATQNNPLYLLETFHPSPL